MAKALMIRTADGLKSFHDVGERIHYYMREQKLYPDVTPVGEGGYFICYLEGDWKHEHGRFDLNLQDLFEDMGIAHFDIHKQFTDTPTSDFWQANHIVMILSDSIEVVEEVA